MKPKALLWIIILCSTISACSKYEDGPLISFSSKGNRVNGTWYFQSVLYGSTDSTPNYTYQKLDFYYSRKYEGGAFTWDHDLFAQTLNERIYETGTWKFTSNKDSFEMVSYRNQLKDSVSIRWKINRLTYNEFWLERQLRDTIRLQMLLMKLGY